MKDDVLPVAYFLVDEEVLDVRTLVATQLDNFTDIFILLDGAVATEILLEGLADPFDVQVVGKSRDRRDTFPPIPLLDTNMDLLLRRSTGIVPSILECVCASALCVPYLCTSLRRIAIVGEAEGSIFFLY